MSQKTPLPHQLAFGIVFITATERKLGHTPCLANLDKQPSHLVLQKIWNLLVLPSHFSDTQSKSYTYLVCLFTLKYPSTHQLSSFGRQTELSCAVGLLFRSADGALPAITPRIRRLEGNGLSDLMLPISWHLLPAEPPLSLAQRTLPSIHPIVLPLPTLL